MLLLLRCSQPVALCTCSLRDPLMRLWAPSLPRVFPSVIQDLSVVGSVPGCHRTCCLACGRVAVHPLLLLWESSCAPPTSPLGGRLCTPYSSSTFLCSVPRRLQTPGRAWTPLTPWSLSPSRKVIGWKIPPLRYSWLGLLGHEVGGWERALHADCPAALRQSLFASR